MEANKIRSGSSGNVTPEYATTDLREYLTEVAEAIRVKTGKEDLIPAQNFVEEILDIDQGPEVETCNITLQNDAPYSDPELPGSLGLYYDPYRNNGGIFNKEDGIYWPNNLFRLVKGSLLYLTFRSEYAPTYIELTGGSRVLQFNQDYAIIHVIGDGDLTIYYHDIGGDE